MLNGNQSFSDVAAKMVVLNRNVLRSRAQFGSFGQFYGAHIIFKNLAANCRGGKGNLDTEGQQFLKQLHDVYNVTQRSGEGNIFCLGSQESDRSLEFGTPNKGATRVPDDVSGLRITLVASSEYSGLKPPAKSASTWHSSP
jgi:hypothetical protein